MKVRSNAAIILLMVGLVVFSAAIVLGGVYFTLAGFFSLIGVTYDSAKSLWLFIGFCLLIGLVFELAEFIILIYLDRMTAITAGMQKIGTVLLKFILTWGVIHIVNDLMTTVTLSTGAELMTVLLMVTVELVFDGKGQEETVVNR